MRTVIKTFLVLAAATTTLAQPSNWSCSSTVSAQPTASMDPQLLQDLQSAPTAIKRFQRLLVQGGSLLTGDALRKLIVFDFKGAQPASGALGGATKAASIETYPFLSGLSISLTAAFLEPCGINTPHVHPRANEFLVLVQGSNLQFGSVLENGLVAAGQNQEVTGTLSQYEGTVFPQGSIHYQFNNACEKAVFFAALDSVDPGTSTIAQNLFSLNTNVLNATLGYPQTIDGHNFEEFKDAIPRNLAQDVGNCLVRCSSQQGEE
ncbi:RmlC-like cupin [Ophiobolus disseminans]|uniref:RmlC-like cupin n=1 Tax=Ophiobolus disseminans TaxID=1469910 RepID=A0A6A6ZBK6_9PLEO|nr:RmlC-like cupin [Ophiobolus disseminans]